MSYSGHLRDALKELTRRVRLRLQENNVLMDWTADGIISPISLGGFPIIRHNLDAISTEPETKRIAGGIIDDEIESFIDQRYKGRSSDWKSLLGA
jgi:hypothetical protein